MNKNHFNVWEFKQVLDLAEKDPISARVLYEEYLKKYPDDYSAYTYYCSNLITLGELELAEKVLNYVEKEYVKKNSFNKKYRIEKFEYNLFFVRIKLLSYQEKYEELYKLCVKNISRVVDKSLNSVWFYSKKRTGRLNDEKRDVNSYLFKQIVRYEESDFYKHIEKHLSSYNENVDVPNSTVFEENFPLKEVVEEIKKYIPSDKRLFLGFYDDIYYFKYDECGRENKKLVNYFKVVCLHNSQDFITMCPMNCDENLPYIDLNYMKKEEPSKVKRLSQIDRFNQRYNIKK